MCVLAMSGPALACDTLPAALRRGVALGIRSGQGRNLSYKVFGIVPAPIETVPFNIKEKILHEAVRRNAYGAVARSPIFISRPFPVENGRARDPFSGHATFP
jgi:hypothetical protein